MMPRSTTALLATPLLFAACHAPGDALQPIQIDTAQHAATYSDSSSSYTVNGGSSYNSYSYSSYNNTYSTQPSGYNGGGGTKSGVSANGPSTDGVEEEELSGLELERSLLDNLGSPFLAKLVDGRSYQMVVVGAFEDEGTGRRYFEVETSIDDQPWIPLCGLDAAGAPILALAVPGVFTAVALDAQDRAGGWRSSSDEFNFACRGSSVAKCVELGYAPHLDLPRQASSGVEQSNGRRQEAQPQEIDTPMAQAYHQACVRMLRADYCGDGESHTQAGVMIRHWDMRAGWPSLEGYDFEAGWSADGATCIEDTRLEHTSVPACVAERTARKCGRNALREALVGDAF